VVFATPDGEVRVRGEPQLIQRLVGHCDGQRTGVEAAAALGSGVRADAEALLEALLELGVLVDCSEAWRVFHAQSSIRSRLGRTVGHQELAAMLDEPPRAAGLTGERVSLPSLSSRVLSLAGRRASATPGSPRPASEAELGTLLAAMYGRGPGGRRTVPSGGALYPLLLHVLVRRTLGGLEPGLWWYEPSQGDLWSVDGEPPSAGQLLVSEPLSDQLLAANGPLVLISADLKRPARKYSNRGYRLALMEAGAAMQNAYLAGTELGVPVRALAGIDEQRTSEQLRLPEQAVTLLAVLVGR